MQVLMICSCFTAVHLLSHVRASFGSRVIMAAASQGLTAGSLLADRQVRPEANPAHRSADLGPPMSAPRWSDASTINTRP